MAWIKIRNDIHDDCSIIQICKSTGLNDNDVVGKLVKLWCWATMNTKDGKIESASYEWVDGYLNAPGFSKAMESVNWLKKNCQGIEFPNWERHLSQAAKNRALSQKRSALYRSRGQKSAVTLASRSRHAFSTPDLPSDDGLDDEHVGLSNKLELEHKSSDDNKDDATYYFGKLGVVQGEETLLHQSDMQKNVIEAWNSLGKPFAKVLHLGNGRRRAHLKARLLDPWWREHWRAALTKIPTIPGMCGQNERGTPVDFEFFVRPDSVTKILEGKYDRWGVTETKERDPNDW